jgi:hypothetical protein
MKTGSKITGNTATSCGISSFTNYYAVGGVFVYNNGTFEMEGGTISDNHATGRISVHGGVFVGKGTFRMTNGTISGNTAYAQGGGSLQAAGGVGLGELSPDVVKFIKTGGTITGVEESNDDDNVATGTGTFYGKGNAVYGYYDSNYWYPASFDVDVTGPLSNVPGETGYNSWPE